MSIIKTKIDLWESIFIFLFFIFCTAKRRSPFMVLFLLWAIGKLLGCVEYKNKIVGLAAKAYW